MAGFEDIRVVVFALVALATGITAVAVLAAQPRRNWNQWLGFFLLLVAGNFAAQLAHALLEGQAPAPDRGRAMATVRSLGYLFVALDPAVLAYFAALFPRRTTLAERWWGVPLLAAPAVVLMGAEVLGRQLSTQPPPLFAPAPIILAVYVAACYGYSAWRILANLAVERSGVMSQQLGVVAFGMAVMALPRVGLLLQEVEQPLRAWWPGQFPTANPLYHLELMAFRLGALVLGYLIIVHLARSATAVARPRFAGVLQWVGPVYVLLGAVWCIGPVISILLTTGTIPNSPVETTLRLTGENLVYAIRWFAFSAAMLVGIVRFQVLDVDDRALRVPSGLVAATLAALAVAAAASLAGPWAAGVAAGAVVLLALGLVLRLPGLAAQGRSESYLHQRRLDVYRASLAADLAEGGAGASAALRGLRDRLGIADREHQALLAVAALEQERQQHPVLGRYRPLRLLGRGGQAEVHLAEDVVRGGQVVLKRLRGARFGAAAARELAVARSTSHPRLVAIHEVLPLPDGGLVVMEYVPGGSLRDRLDRDGALPPREVARVLGQALEGLGALHEAGVVHGDLKPENLLLDERGEVKVADFASARAKEGHRTLVPGTVQGGATLRYAPPEVLLGGEAGEAADLYALGVVALELLRGDLPAGAPGQAVRDAPPPWRPFLARALDPDPRRRFPSAPAMREALKALERAVPPAEVPG